jgi:hypothetical protein
VIEVEKTTKYIINPNKMNKEQLREGNDALRRCLNASETERPQDGVFLTRGVMTCSNLREVLHKVMAFDGFEAGNDPYEEHDFGKVTVDGEDYFFKFDYYDEDMKYGADPLSQPFRRILTILRAEEY